MLSLPCPTEESSRTIIQPPLEIGSFVLSEPVIVLTDLMVSAMCFYAFFKLRNYAGPSRIRTYLVIYFLGMGIATTVGGLVGHGLMYYLDFAFKLPGWFTSMIAIAVFERANIEVARPYIKKSIGRFFAWLNIVELLTFMTVSFTTLCFFWVEVHTTYGLLIVVNSFSLYTYFSTRNRGSKYFLFGVGTAAIAALVFSLELTPHIWFTHIDVSHILMCLASWFFYRGSRILIEQAGSVPAN